MFMAGSLVCRVSVERDTTASAGHSLLIRVLLVPESLLVVQEAAYFWVSSRSRLLFLGGGSGQL